MSSRDVEIQIMPSPFIMGKFKMPSVQFSLSFKDSYSLNK